MQIPRSYVENYSKALNVVSERARAALVDALSQIDYSADVASIRQAVIAIMQPACGASSTMAARLASDFYDGLRARFGIDDGFRAGVDARRVPEATEGAVRAFAQDLVDKKPTEQFIGKCADRIDYETRLAANQCIEYNARNDPKKPRWARVPTGAETCQFCIMLASRGFVYHSEETVSHAHAHCDCRVVPSWDKKNPAVQGYDPDLYYDMWQHPERYQEPDAEQRNLSPQVPINRTTTQTTIAECASQANPKYSEVIDARNRRDALVSELNAMLPITSSNSSDYATKYAEYRNAQREFDRVHREYGKNCQRCVVAYELRRRGYDVSAKKRLARNDVVASNWNRLFVNQQFTNVGHSDATVAIRNLETELGQYGDGARSIVYVKWQSGGAHVFIAEHQNGVPVYVDPQSGTVDYTAWQSSFEPSTLLVSRVDDKQIDMQYLDRTVKVNR